MVAEAPSPPVVGIELAAVGSADDWELVAGPTATVVLVVVADGDVVELDALEVVVGAVVVVVGAVVVVVDVVVVVVVVGGVTLPQANQWLIAGS